LIKHNDILSKGLQKLGILYTENQINCFDTYIKFFTNENQIKNLSSIKDEKEIVIKHFLDSLSGLQYINDYYEKGYQIIDLGSGGGFPGIPLKIAKPQWKIDLSEVNKKKIEFLKQLLEKLNIRDCNIIDSSQMKIPKKYHIVVSRAFGKLDKNISEAIKYLQENGLIILYKAKADKIEEEINNSKEVNTKNVKYIKKIQLNVPFLEAQRHLVIFKV
jgi:16S rRNA (guanine527-N7)-methyltransferase